MGRQHAASQHAGVVGGAASYQQPTPAAPVIQTEIIELSQQKTGPAAMVPRKRLGQIPTTASPEQRRRRDHLRRRPLGTRLDSPDRAPSDCCLAMAKEASRKRRARVLVLVRGGHVEPDSPRPCSAAEATAKDVSAALRDTASQCLRSPRPRRARTCARCFEAVSRRDLDARRHG
jgi:hypothetical protein